METKRRRARTAGRPRIWAAIVGAAVAVLIPGIAFSQSLGDLTGLATGAMEEIGDLGLDFGLGVNTFEDLVTGETQTFQALRLKPDIPLGPVGIGLDVTLNYTFTGGEDGTSFEVRADDWIPNDDLNFFEIYLQKIRYVRYGTKGEPLFAMLGSIDYATLGNGFLLSGYANTRFLPDRRLFGLSFDLDGALFNFPYLGMETFISNVAAFDMMGGRLFTRPFAWLDVPVISRLQLGGSLVTDRDVFYHAEKDPGFSLDSTDGEGDLTTLGQYNEIVFGESTTETIYDATTNATVLGTGIDFSLPILTNPVFSLITYGDFVWQTADRLGTPRTGGMFGVGGSIFSFLPYVLQLRFLGENFIPEYFDATYDVDRVKRYATIASNNAVTSEYVGWYGNTGVNFLDGKALFNIALDGPFVDPGSSLTPFQDLHLRAVARLAEGVLPGVSLEASYDKRGISEWASLLSPVDAIVGAKVGYTTGPVVVELTYDLTYDPFSTEVDDEGNPVYWQIRSGLDVSLAAF